MAVRYEITVNQRQLASLRKKLEPKQYAKILFGIARKAASIGAQEIRSQHWDIGATTRATIFESTSFGARIATRSPGARAVEYGRHAGAAAPPASVLHDWASRHGLAGLEIPIARAIARRGIKGRFFMRRTRERLKKSVIPRLLNEAIGEIRLIWTKP